MTRCRVSVIVPVRNMLEFLPAAVRSIADQSRPADEIVIVDDGSTDGTLEILHRLRKENPLIRVMEGPRETAAAARNAAFEQASGDVIAFLDGDDLWPRDKLQRQIDRLERSPVVDAVWGKVRWFDRQHDTELRPADDARIADVFGVNLGAGIIRRGVLDRIGPLDASLTYSEDVDFVLRIRDFGIRLAVLPSVALYYRRHEQGMTAKLTPREQSDMQRVIFRCIARRGNSEGLSRTGVLTDLVETET